jgi:hypothetical protein
LIEAEGQRPSILWAAVILESQSNRSYLVILPPHESVLVSDTYTTETESNPSSANFGESKHKVISIDQAV